MYERRVDDHTHQVLVHRQRTHQHVCQHIYPRRLRTCYHSTHIHMSIHISASKNWNTLPLEVRQSHSLSTFRNCLKDILFQISLSVLLATCHQCALILLETSALYKLFTYLLTYQSNSKEKISHYIRASKAVADCWYNTVVLGDVMDAEADNNATNLQLSLLNHPRLYHNTSALPSHHTHTSIRNVIFTAL